MSIIKKQLFEQLALIAHSLGSPQRVEMLDYLAQAECSVDELSRLVDLTVANTSRHLHILKQNGLVLVRKDGKRRLYKIAGNDVVLLISCLRKTAETHLAEVDRLMLQITPNSLEKQTISSKELVSKFDEQELLILDVRPKREFLQGHIRGAINVQPEEIHEKIQDLPANKIVVAYCRGPYCLYSYEMIDSLREKGIEALRLEDGFPEWKAAGFPYE
ncbi:metalloregulator ArsR/SmtB family transcription factor [Shewanella sp. D64]|uniref:ArsR/SmtB family transcription factor n=1 Tax=unclassified Shewanella TaxID=196818 RepID=UPI0022BA4ED7|nr:MULTISPECIES: metalloregulator ArsR/SmtB family transcription factor [unclassified Shewanella]MEC4727538.1 metalloregulator ArsR/SmtB family transcription factor [Shewanella sp. D64]MEC4738053.1 metalloregulator ArsR/SmtB family transcription factor [Shewanella sp. E94]WBJ96431.1 metalloregulator ArsR/SmtB family transcription factor [Shewanella sp. MTB7]